MSAVPHRLDVATGRRVAVALARDGVVRRQDLLRRGVPRWLVKAELRAGRWQRTGRQTVAVHNGPLGPSARRRIALSEIGPRAALDGVSALQVAGVHALTDEVVHVIIPKGASPRRRLAGVRVHESRRFREEDVHVRDGMRVVRPAVAAVHAALWAVSDRQAEHLLLLAVQQRVCTPGQLADAVLPVRRDRRRRLLVRVVEDVAGGVRSIGELDVARGLRRRGLPEPDRQVVRLRPSGRQYLDCRFTAYRVTLEIDGSQHDDAEHRLADLLRDLELAADGDVVVRIPLVAWRWGSEEVLDRLEGLFRARGWRPAAA